MNKNLKKAMGLVLSTTLTLTLFSAYKSASHATAKASEEKVLNIFTWDKYIPQNVLDQFKKETGIKINYSNFESNEEMLTKLKAAKGGSYDIVIASDYILDIARKSKLLSTLDKKKIPNFKNIDPTFQSQYYDQKNQYTVPYIAGTPLIVYDPKKVKIKITGYNDLWNPALKDSVVTLDDQRNIIGITLKTLGKSFNTTDAATLKKAKEKLFKLKPNIRALDYNTPQNLLLNGEASVAYMFTSQVVAALNKRPDLKVVYPKEGMGFGIDNVVVPVKAPHKSAAHKFLNFILKPKVGAEISSQLLYLCPNKASKKYLPKSFLNNKALYIPSNILGKTEFIKDVSKATKIYDQIWTEFKQK